MKKIVYIFVVALLLVSCGKSDTELATMRLIKANSLVEEGNLNQAKIEIDSIHQLYPREVAVRREAKALQDSIVYIEAKRNLAYSDSLLQTLLPQVDPLLKLFRYEKNEKYEDDGRYVHRLLQTGSNTSRCFLQCYLTDQRKPILKSYYFGSQHINHRSLTLSTAEAELTAEGDLHSFDAEGAHEILSVPEDRVLEVLNFVSANRQQRIKVLLQGDKQYGYYLQDSEKEALENTYQLAVLMYDIHRLEEQIRIASMQIDRYENNRQTR